MQLFVKQIKSLNSKLKINEEYNKEDDKVHPLLLSLGFYFLFIPFISILCGIISLHQINKNPDKYTGKKWAIFEITCGTIITALALIFSGFVILKILE